MRRSQVQALAGAIPFAFRMFFLLFLCYFEWFLLQVRLGWHDSLVLSGHETDKVIPETSLCKRTEPVKFTMILGKKSKTQDNLEKM
ncbi:hypothetical protein DER45DRAFT_237236 [Fusarium avenaceum]|nr:hypothetical protein DER45DRAFT_237236 [Fusarium avenaceum]